MPSDAGPINRALLLTPAGGAAIAVVRLSGPGVPTFLDSHFSRSAAVGRAVHGDLHDANAVLDDPVIVLSREGSTADLCLHGGPWIIQSVLDLAVTSGFQVTDPGLPLPAAAVDASSEIEAELLTHLPLARTETAVRLLLAQRSAWERLERDLCHPGRVSREDIASILDDLSLHRLLHPPVVVIAGPANVGKSTLANQLFSRERSITADLPGTTRDWVGDEADIDGLPVTLVDTPGMRATSDPIEAAAMERAAGQTQKADLALVVMEADRWQEHWNELKGHPWPPMIRVLNKIDLAGDRPVPLDAIGTVATTGHGIDAVRRAITSHFGCDQLDSSKPRCWTERQRQRLCRLTESP